MSWSEVKYALNSTLGTEDFMPLNEIFQNSIFLKSGDSILKKISENLSFGNIQREQKYNLGSHIFNINGVVTIKITNNFSGGGAGNLIVIMNDNQIMSPSMNNNVINVNVKKGDELQLQVEVTSPTIGTGGAGLFVSSIDLCGETYFAPVKGV